MEIREVRGVGMPNPPRPSRRLIGHAFPEPRPLGQTMKPEHFMFLPRDQVEQLYKYGRIDATDWMMYRFYWRNSTFRYSTLDSEFDIVPGQYDD